MISRPVSGQHQDPGIRVPPGDSSDGVQTGGAICHQVHDDQIRQLVAYGLHQRGAVLRLPYHLIPGYQSDHRPQPGPYHRVFVGDKDSRPLCFCNHA